MRLLRTDTGRFIDATKTNGSYAILSHVWAKPGEPGYPEKKYEEIDGIPGQHSTDLTMSILSKLPEKVRRFCEVASKDGDAEDKAI